MFEEKKFLYLFLIPLLINLASGKKKSADNYFDVCSKSDPDVNNCIQAGINRAMPRFVKGIPDLKLPSIDPMFITTLAMKEGDGNFRFELVMINVTMAGLQRAAVEDFRISIANEMDVTMKFTLPCPWISFKSKYKMGGRILVIPVEGNGDLFFNFTRSNAKATVKAHLINNQKDQKDYLNIDSFNWDISIGGGKAHFTNLFNGDKRLGMTINKFFNDNLMEIFSSLKHLPEQALGYVFKNYSNVIFKNYPFEELLPR